MSRDDWFQLIYRTLGSIPDYLGVYDLELVDLRRVMGCLYKQDIPSLCDFFKSIVIAVDRIGKRADDPFYDDLKRLYTEGEALLEKA